VGLQPGMSEMSCITNKLGFKIRLVLRKQLEVERQQLKNLS